MPTPDHLTKLAITLPWWQVLAILAGFPLLYLANNFTPWSKGLFVKRDHRYFLPVFSTILLLHWTSVAVMLLFLQQSGRSLKDIGLPTSTGMNIMMGGGFLVLAVAIVIFRQTRPANYPSRLPSEMPPIMPVNLSERLFWIFASATAGICEELIYRGFAICALHGLGVPIWLAIILAGIAFVLIHGLWGLRRFWRFLLSAAVFSALFLLFQNLLPVMFIHALWDMFFILGG